MSVARTMNARTKINPMNNISRVAIAFQIVSLIVPGLVVVEERGVCAFSDSIPSEDAATVASVVSSVIGLIEALNGFKQS